MHDSSDTKNRLDKCAHEGLIKGERGSRKGHMLRFDAMINSMIPYLSMSRVMCTEGNEVLGHEFSLNGGCVMNEFSYEYGSVYELMLHFMTK